MDNRTKFHFDDFTEKNYSRLIKLAKKHYDFESYGTHKTDNHVIWKHDVDVSVHRALKLAKIESRLNVKTTYFLRLHSEFYNLFEKPVFDLVHKIIDLGHDIGLHYEYHFYSPGNSNTLETNLKLERRLLEKLFCIKINSFSFHNAELAGINKIKKIKIPGMVNAYSNYMWKNYFYCSDSSGYWRFSRLEDVLKNRTHSRLHILTHPVWWQKSVLSPRKRILRSIEHRAKNSYKNYHVLLKSIKRLDVDT